MRLTKSRKDVMISGVLGGLGEYYGVDPTIIRIVFAVLMFMTPLPLIPLYILGAIIIPEAPKEGEEEKRERKRKSRPRNRRPRETRHFTRKEEAPKKPSPRKDVTEDDWSDF